MTQRQTAGAGSLAQRLAAARTRGFVGRAAELELFRRALLDDEPPFSLLHVYGPGGVGKTTLLAEFRRIADEHGVATVTVDGHSVEASPAAFLAAMAVSGSARPQSPPSGRSLLVIDTYESLKPLDRWLREEFLPQLPGDTLVVIASRHAPTPGWRSDPGWQHLMRVVSLRNLRPDESREYLARRGVSDAAQDAALSMTHGHPLALSLVADVVAASERPPVLSIRQDPNVVKVLLERFVENVPSEAHRRALYIAAQLRVTTESLLADLLDDGDAHEVFEWLASLSFVERGPEGVFPHDLARDVLDADLRWRDPDSHMRIDRTARASVADRFASADDAERQRLCMDLLYLHRNNPARAIDYDWDALGKAYAEPASEADRGDILDMVRRHEGEASAEVAATWFDRYRAAFYAFRADDERPIGFTAMLPLHAVSADARDSDPVTRAVWEFISRRAPPRPGEAVHVQRFNMDREAYQKPSRGMNVVATTHIFDWLGTPSLAWSIVAVSDRDAWHDEFTSIRFHPIMQEPVEVGGHPYWFYAHDWRAEPQADWMRMTGPYRNQVLTGPATPADQRAPLVVLSQPEFHQAVRQVLRDFTRPDALRDSPLLRSRVARDAAGGEPTPETLRSLLREAADALKANPKDERLYRVLHRTYFEPAATQELAAEVLDLPFSTYRRYLRAGTQRVADWLWQRELYGRDA